MDRTPEGALVRAQDRLSLEDMIERSDNMAQRIMASPALLREIGDNIQALLSETGDRESLAAQIAERHPEAIPDTMEEPKSRAALVLRIAELKDKQRRHIR